MNHERCDIRDNPPRDPGSEHFDWVRRFLFILLPVGTAAWWTRSRTAAGVFFVAGLGSLVFWVLHRFLVTRMLTPKVRLRWFYATLTLLKLTLIIFLVRGIIRSYPMESLPLATGLLLFVLAILLEALRLARISFFPSSPDNPR